MGLTEDRAGRTELTRAILKKDIADYVKTYPRWNAGEEGV